MGARDKINAISLIFRINKRKLVHIHGYKLPINVQNFMQKDSAQAKISLKVVGGGTFLFTLYVHCSASEKQTMLRGVVLDQTTAAMC